MRSAVLLDGGTRFFGRRNVQAAFALRGLRRGPRSGSARSLRGEPPLRKTCPQRRFARGRISAECRRPGAASRFRPFAGCVDFRSRTNRPEEARGGGGRSPRKRASAEWGGRGLAPPAGAGRRDGASGPRPCRSSAAEDRTGCCGGSALRRKRPVRKPERCEGCSAGIGRGGLRDCVVCGGTSVADEKDGSRMNGSPPPGRRGRLYECLSAGSGPFRAGGFRIPSGGSCRATAGSVPHLFVPDRSADISWVGVVSLHFSAVCGRVARAIGARCVSAADTMPHLRRCKSVFFVDIVQRFLLFF